MQEIESICGKVEYMYLKNTNSRQDIRTCLRRLIDCENIINQKLHNIYGGSNNAGSK